MPAADLLVVAAVEIREASFARWPEKVGGGRTLAEICGRARVVAELDKWAEQGGIMGERRLRAGGEWGGGPR